MKIEKENAVVSPLFIDKVTLTFPIVERLDEVIERVQELFQSDAGTLRPHVPAFKEGHRYRQNYKLLNHRKKSIAFIQLAPLQSDKVNALRVSFNPQRIGKSSCRQIHDHLVEILGDMNKQVLENAKCTRLDLSVDVTNASIESMMIYATGKQYSSIWASDYDKWGNLTRQTIYIGSTKSDSRIIVYDKRTELERPWPPITRIELRLTNLRSLSLEYLARRIDNPFAGIRISSLAFVDSAVNDAMAWFLDSCRVRGAHAAIKLSIDKNRREMCKDLLATASVEWWWPDQVWAGLPVALKAIAPFLDQEKGEEDGRGDIAHTTDELNTSFEEEDDED